MKKEHWAIFITNDTNTSKLIHKLLKGCVTEFPFLIGLKPVLFSKSAVAKLMDEEDRQDTKVIDTGSKQPLRTMSSGEQKKALLRHLFQGNSDCIILDHPFDNLDTESQKQLVITLEATAQNKIYIQIISRKEDLLSFISNFASLANEALTIHKDLSTIFQAKENTSYTRSLPLALHPIKFKENVLIALKDVSVKYGDKKVLNSINWKIKKGDFWQLIGKNGSGKTTILSMIIGDNQKAYGQEIFLFGIKKGSGESVWDIKKKIGYFTPAMTDNFKGHHSIEHMLISGFNDSIGLYVKPTEAQLRVVKEWLLLIGMWEIKNKLFVRLSTGQKRLVMTTRAMIKHPLLLILDEPTEGLDDASAKLLVELVNKIANESNTATVFVSHRKEPGLNPDFIYELQNGIDGAIGLVR